MIEFGVDDSAEVCRSGICSVGESVANDGSDTGGGDELSAVLLACDSYQNSESTVWVACLMFKYCPKKYGGNGGSVGDMYSCLGI